jgi:hypothetical protein
MNKLLLGYSPDFDLFEEAPSLAPSPEHESPLQGSSDRSEAATELLEVAGRPALPALLSRLVRDATHTAGPALDRAVEGELLRLLQRAARIALPTGGLAAHDTATQASRFFGIELEGLSPEDQEFEAARRFIQLVEAASQHAAAGSQRLPPAVAAWLATARAAKRFAPGWAAALHAPPHRSARIAARGSRPATFQGAHHA